MRFVRSLAVLAVGTALLLTGCGVDAESMRHDIITAENPLALSQLIDQVVEEGEGGIEILTWLLDADNVENSYLTNVANAAELSAEGLLFKVGEIRSAALRGLGQIASPLSAQAIIDSGMDDAALAMFNRARQLYPIGDIMPEPDLSKWTEVNVDTQLEARGVRVKSTDDSSYSLHTWDEQTIPVEEGETYVYRFWAQLGEFDVADYTLYDVTNGAFIANVVDYSGQLNHDSMTMVDVEIVIPAGCTELAVSPFRGGDGPADVIFKRVQAIFKR